MQTIFKLAILAPIFVLMFMVDVPPERQPLQIQLVPDAHAVLGVRRRSFRRGVAVGAAAGEASAASSSQTAQAQQQTAQAQQQTAQAQQQTAQTQQQTAQTQQQTAQAQQQTAATGQPLPIGTVVPSLPAGCTPTAVGGVEYYKCGVNYYRTAFQGSQLVYVTAKP